jgi:hypothetical protein
MKELCVQGKGKGSAIASGRASDSVSDADLLPFWQRMIELLPVVRSDESEEAVRIRLTMFQRFVTDAPRGMAQPQNFSQGRSPPIRPVPKKPGRKHRRRRWPAPVQNPAYLSFDVVRDLFYAASFLLQQYGPRCFNTQITIPYGLFKFNDVNEESQLLIPSEIAHHSDFKSPVIPK